MGVQHSGDTLATNARAIVANSSIAHVAPTSSRQMPVGANDGPNRSSRLSRPGGIFQTKPPIRSYPLKRAIDVAGSLVLLFALTPLMVLTAVAIWMFDPGPVLFSQVRIGAGGRHFKVLKFRTMRTDADEMLARLIATDPSARKEWGARQKLAKDPRITWLGKFLRRSSIDELPQFLNVLKGEMSLVGPRPILATERTHYGRHTLSYCSVKPGLTGLWQVSGRNNTTYARRVALDVTYSRRISLALDLKILVATIPAVLGAKGCY